MKFRVGQTVKLINNSGMVAEPGATATVISVGNKCIKVMWKTKSKHQMNGHYGAYKFKSITKNQQLLFSFMEKK